MRAADETPHRESDREARVPSGSEPAARHQGRRTGREARRTAQQVQELQYAGAGAQDAGRAVLAAVGEKRFAIERGPNRFSSAQKTLTSN